MPHQALSFISSGTAEMMMSINGIPDNLPSYSIPLTLLTPEAGNYQLSFEGMETFTKGSCFVIEDLLDNSFHSIHQGMEYNFNSQASQMAQSRFVLHISTAPEILIHPATCSNKSDGAVELNRGFEGNSIVEFRHISSGKSISADFNTYRLMQGGFSEGAYLLTLHGNSVCGKIELPFSIESVSAGVSDIQILGTENTQGGIKTTLKLTGAAHTRLVEWDFGDGNMLTAGAEVVHSYAVAGTYQVKARTHTEDCNDYLVLNTNIAASNDEYMAVEMLNGKWYANYLFREESRINLHVYNAMGQSVKTFETKGNQGQLPIDLSELSGGVYWIKLQANGKEMTRKVVQ
jgi:hypothetical protein